VATKDKKKSKKREEEEEEPKKKKKVVEEEEEEPKKKSKKKDEEEETEEKDKDKPEAVEYAGDKQPYWVKNEPDFTAESESGFRWHFFQDKDLVMLTGKDWEGEGTDGSEGLHPGKTIKLKFTDMVQLLNQTLKSLGFEGAEIELPEEEEEE